MLTKSLWASVESLYCTYRKWRRSKSNVNVYIHDHVRT